MAVSLSGGRGGGGGGNGPRLAAVGIVEVQQIGLQGRQIGLAGIPREDDGDVTAFEVPEEGCGGRRGGDIEEGCEGEGAAGARGGGGEGEGGGGEGGKGWR